MNANDHHNQPDENTPTIFLGGSDHEGIDLPAHLRLEPGDQVSHYKIISLVAEGGFGIVYLAEQHTPVKRRVALKIIKPGMDTVAVITRFEAERQALAILDHPNIATVYDAGATDDGRPFFVMEYVEGVPITEYCDDYRLDTSQRLNLMIDVCAAIQHAHMKGIIHRDLKPSNILVAHDEDGPPRAKVIDFGVAKATSMELTERSFCTETGQLIGTPEYMSPEQADLGATDIDTRSDVYSLGMILYELITGALPFESIQMRQAGFSELCRIIQEETPPKPSTRLLNLGGEASKVATKRKTRPADLVGMLKKELEWIPLKALRKLRDERYESAVALSEDIKRYLEGDVLVAGPETSTYRLKKFLRRNRSGFFVAFIVFLSLLVGLYVALIQLDKVKKQNIVSQTQNDKIERMQAELQTANLNLEEELAKKRREQEETAKLNQKLLAAQQELQQVNYISNLLTASMSVESKDYNDALYRLRMASIGQEAEKPFEWRHLWVQADESLGLVNQPNETPLMAFDHPNTRVFCSISPSRFAVWDASQMFLDEQSDPDAALKISNQDPNAVRMSPDRKLIVLADENDEQQIVETSNAKVLQTIPSPHESNPHMVFSGDGRRLAHGMADRELHITNSRTGRRISSITLPADTSRIVMDMTGSRIAAITRNQVQLLNANTGERSVRPMMHDLDVTAAAFDNSAIQLVTGTMSGEIRIWDVLTGRESAKWETPVRLISSIEFNPNGNLVLLSNERNKHAIVDISNGEILFEPTGGWSLSPDWGTIAYPSDKDILTVETIGDAQSPVELMVSSASASSFTGNSQRIVTADSSGNLEVWDLLKSPPSSTFIGHHEDPITDVFFTNNDERVLVNSESGARLWSAKGLEDTDRINTADHDLTTWSFSPTNSWLLTGTSDGDIMVIDLMTGEIFGSIKGHDAEIVDLVVSGDGQRVISSSRDNTLRLWSLMTGKELFKTEREWWSESPTVVDDATGLLAVQSQSNDVQIVDMKTGSVKATLTGHDAPVKVVSFDPNSTHMATGDARGELRIWPVESGVAKSRLQAHETSINDMTFDRQGRLLLTASDDGSIRAWDVNKGIERPDLRIPVRQPVKRLLLSSDGTRILSGLGDGSIQIWSMQTGDKIHSLPSNGSAISSLNWSPDEERLVAISEDGSVRSWSGSNWRKGISLPGNANGGEARGMSPDRDRIATVSRTRSIPLHDVDSGEIIFTLRGDDENISLLDFTPDGNSLVAASTNGPIKVWTTRPDSMTAEAIDQHVLMQDRLKSTVENWMTTANGDLAEIESRLSQESTYRSSKEMQALQALLIRSLIGN